MRRFIMILGFLILISGVVVAFGISATAKILHGELPGIQTKITYPYATVGAVIAMIGGATMVIGYAMPRSRSIRKL